MPIAFLIYAIIKKEIVPFILGVAAFTISQLLIRLPLLGYLAKESASYHIIQVTQPIVFLLLVSFSAGLFEETARWVFMRYMLKKRTISKGVYFGLGHGGIEASVLVGIPMLLQFVQYHSLPALNIYLGAFERIAAIVVHVCLSLIVLHSVSNRKIIYYVLAIFIHGVINFTTLIISTYISPLASEIGLAILTVILILYTIYLIRRGRDDEQKISIINR